MSVLQPLKWHGGKYYLAKKIISLMPPRDTWHLYREPCAGGLAVLLTLDPEGLSEAVNDRNGELTNFWRVLQGRKSFAEFERILQAVPFSQSQWEQARDHRRRAPSPVHRAPSPVHRALSPVHRAAYFFIRARQSRQGLMRDFATPTRRLRRGQNENVSAWCSAVDGLAAVHARLRRVEVRNMDACEFIRRYDDPDAVHYSDPPYLHATRTAKNCYAFEMTDRQHAELLECLSGIQGRFLLSGYRSALYDQVASRQGWNRSDFQIDNKSGSGPVKQTRTECVWTNF